MQTRYIRLPTTIPQSTPSPQRSLTLQLALEILEIQQPSLALFDETTPARNTADVKHVWNTPGSVQGHRLNQTRARTGLFVARKENQNRNRHTANNKAKQLV